MTRLNSLSCPEAKHTIDYDAKNNCRVLRFHCPKLDLVQSLPPDLGLDFACEFPQCLGCFYRVILDPVPSGMNERGWQ